MISFELSDEQRMYQATARDFAIKEIAPAAAAILSRNPATQTPRDVFRPAYRQAVELGFSKLLIPEQYGGLGGSCLENVIVMEEFGAVDLGIAASYLNASASGGPGRPAGGSGALAGGQDLRCRRRDT